MKHVLPVCVLVLGSGLAWEIGRAARDFFVTVLLASAAVALVGYLYELRDRRLHPERYENEP